MLGELTPLTHMATTTTRSSPRRLLGRRAVMACLAAGLLGGCAGQDAGLPTAASAPAATPEPTPALAPNLVLVLADDLGYGDLSVYGAPAIRTPNLDRLAAQGLLFRNLTVPSTLCTPSRGALLTGRYPPRTGLVWNLPSGPPDSVVLEGDGSGGIRDDEITIADALRAQGYATMAVGKWHLGHQYQFLPTQHGFDHYYGLPSGQNTSLIVRDDHVADRDDQVGLDQLTVRYTQEAVDFVSNAPEPYFLYLAHKAPHVPLEPSGPWVGHSAAGPYGDVVEELDWGVGQLADAIERRSGRPTVLIFLSDQGPWLAEGEDAGSPGPFRGGKGSVYEGGVRVPGIAWGPGVVTVGETNEIVSSLDVFPTFVALAGGRLATDRAYDGMDIGALLRGQTSRLPGSGLEGARELVYYYRSAASALRSSSMKYIAPGWWDPAARLYDVDTDPTESRDLTLEQPALAAALADRLALLGDQIASGAPQPAQ